MLTNLAGILPESVALFECLWDSNHQVQRKCILCVLKEHERAQDLAISVGDSTYINNTYNILKSHKGNTWDRKQTNSFQAVHNF